MVKKYEDKGLEIENNREPNYDIDKIFVQRWSPRAFDPTPVDSEVLNTCFEAARWSMSCFNEQPWLFVYADNPDDLEKYRGPLSEWNQRWCASVPVLGYIFAKKRFDKNDKNNDWANFDTGAAWMAFTMQARILGLYTHGMAGFDKDEAYELTGVPSEDYNVICAFALGKYGDKEALDEDIKKSEYPNSRKPMENMVARSRYSSK